MAASSSRASMMNVCLALSRSMARPQAVEGVRGWDPRRAPATLRRSKTSMTAGLWLVRARVRSCRERFPLEPEQDLHSGGIELLEA